MSIITALSTEELRAERRQRIAETGLDERALRALASEWNLSASEADALSRIEQIDFLLGETE